MGIYFSNLRAYLSIKSMDIYIVLMSYCLYTYKPNNLCLSIRRKVVESNKVCTVIFVAWASRYILIIYYYLDLGSGGCSFFILSNSNLEFALHFNMLTSL
jgi:hypothetical protein